MRLRALVALTPMPLCGACVVSAVVESYAAVTVDAGATHDASTASDTGSDAGPSYGCDVGFMQQGDWVTMTTDPAGNILPMGAGGTVLAGTYVLSGLESYLGGPTGNIEARATLLVIGGAASGTFQTLSEVMGSSTMIADHGPEGATLTYTTEPTVESLDVTNTCPLSSLDAYGYTATSTTLTLYDEQTQLAWAYTLK